MSQFVIERTLPGAGKMSDTEMQQISEKSNDVLHRDDGRRDADPVAQELRDR